MAKITLVEGQDTEKVSKENVRFTVATPVPDKVETLTLAQVDNQIALTNTQIENGKTILDALTKKREALVQAIKAAGLDE